ncbi:MAG: tRNA (guanosine(37)-N1)-methyltransferase TrmD [Candidatus Omnitrophica bacterium]|nr:tRNA (guanosine(37)-N1)-methyltransferase TrmD [Candidatus Omnitrophota bacterium]
MQVDIVTIFPEIFPPVFGASILKRAQENRLLKIKAHDLRDFTRNRHRKIDDRPYGGGPGMLMQAEPIFKAVEALQKNCPGGACQTILLSPQGEVLTSSLAKELAGLRHLILLCGHYEGVDERVRQGIVDRSVSIGDYVLTGGELPAMVLIDCMARFIPGVIGHADATTEESFVNGLLEYPQYTRPSAFRKMRVPKVLLCGDHQRIAQWRKRQALAKTKNNRPDLLARKQPK